jgi:biotin carboxyl carrier protein
MKFHAEVSGEEHEIEITREGEKVFAQVDGRRYELEASEPEPGVFLIKNHGKVFEAIVTQPSSAAQPKLVSVGGDEFEIRLVDPKRLRNTAGGDVHAGGLAEIRTAMPGKVVRVIAAVGTEVGTGQGVIVVEAMKMQNELKSPKNGVVKEIRIAEGDTVGAGDVLATVE